jgi:hypothetical protein
MARTRAAAFITCMVAALGAAAPAVANDRVIARQHVYSMSAYAGTLVWGDDADYSRGYWSWHGGAVTRLAIPRANKDGDLLQIGLGPGRDGRLEAVYERCRYSSFDAGSSGCDIVRYDFAKRRVRKVPYASTGHWEGRAPSTWRGRLLFFRVGRTRQGNNVGGLFSGPRLHHLVRLHRLPDTDGSVETDLRARTVAYSAVSRGRSVIAVKRVDRRGHGRECVVARTGSIGNPQLDGPYVYWAFQDAAGASAVHRRLLPGANCEPRGREQQTRVLNVYDPDGEYTSSLENRYAVDGGRLFYANDNRKRLYEAEQPLFTDR